MYFIDLETFLDNVIALVQSYRFSLLNLKSLAFSFILRKFCILKAKETIRDISRYQAIGQEISENLIFFHICADTFMGVV